MMIDIYTTDSRPDALSKNITPVKSSITIINKSGIDILTPDIIVEYDSDLIGANYFYVDTFGRYYYYRKPPAIMTGGRMCIFGAVDVLMTYGAGIRDCNALILRQSQPTDIDDSKFPLSPESWITSIKLSSPFTESGSFRYVMGVNGTYAP